MLNKLKDRLEEAAEDARQAEREARREYEAAFGDPLVLETEWKPAARGGTNIRSRVLKQPAPHRLTFRPSPQAFLFAVALALIGAALLYVQPLQDIEQAWVQPAVGVGLLAAALGAGFRVSKPVVIDRRLGLCWSGWRAPGSVEAARARKDCAVLEDVRAVQVIRERTGRGDSSGGGNKSYDSYEINLVRADGSRLNLVDHAKLQIIRNDAEAIGALLEVPVWDASDFGRGLWDPSDFGRRR